MRVPPFWMAPPLPSVELPEMVELEMETVPELLKAPLEAEVLFAPVTVTPEMERLPPVSIEKILKLPPLASMVSAEAPSPLMVRVPTVVPVPPVPEAVAVASKIVGNAPASVMV